MTYRWIISAVAAALVLGAPAGAQSRQEPGFRVELGEAQDPGSVRMRAWLEQTHVLPMFAMGLSRWIRMPRPVTLRAAECATSDVRWVPEQAAVEICYRMGMRIQGRLTVADSTRNAFRGALSFLILHGVAHAVVDEMDLPTANGEEQAVDEVMALMMVPQGDQAATAVLQAIQTLQRADPTWNDWEWARTHQLTPARVENIACIAYGANPPVFRHYRESGLIPPARAGGCAAAYNRVYNGLGRRLQRHMN